MGTPPTFSDGSVPHATDLAFALDPPRAAVSTASTSLADNVSTPITWTTMKWDTDTMWNAGTPTRLTVKTPGLYQLTIFARVPSANYGQLQLNPRLNAGGVPGSGTTITTYPAWNLTVTGTVNSALAASLTLEQPFAANDYVELFVLQKSGATRTFEAGIMYLRWVAYT